MPDAIRPVYTPSGRLIASDLAVSAVTFAVLSLSLAAGFAYLTRVDWYAVGWIWALPVLALCGFVRWAIGGSMCRNRPVAFAFGVFGGILVVAGMYHVDQCKRWRVGWERIDRIPGYVVFRMATDEWQFPQIEVVTVSPALASPGIDPWLARPNAWNWHWLAFLGELGVFVVLPGCVGFLRAGHPFSERFDNWFQHEAVGVSRASASALRRALTERTLATWVETERAATQPSKPRRRVTVGYCSRQTLKQTGDSEVYLSIGFGRPQLLEPDEANVLISLFPRLETSADADSLKHKYKSGSSKSADQSLAQFLRIPGPFVARAKDEGVRLRGRLLSSVMLFVPIVLLLAWAFLIPSVQETIETLKLPQWLLGFYIFGLGGGLFFGINWSYKDESHIGFRALRWYYRSIITCQASQRPDPLFPPDHPDVIDSTMAPRCAWANPPRQRCEYEGGLLLIDSEGGVLLFEGDRYRYIVPVGSLVHWGVEQVPNRGTTPPFYAVVLIVNTTDGTQELPIVPSGRIEGRSRLDKALALQARVDALVRDHPNATSPET